MPTNTRESGLESLIVDWLVHQNGYRQGDSADYNREYAVDELCLFRFLEDTQPDQTAKLGIKGSDIKRIQFLDRLRGEIAKRGIIDVLRKGINAYPAKDLIMFKELEESAQIEFKASAKAFVRTYGFLGAILPYGNPEWEKLSIFLNLLLPKLPSPIEEDLSQGILDAIDLDSYRADAMAQMAIVLEDSNAEIDPVPTSGLSGVQNPELEYLTIIISSFNDTFGNIWKDPDNVKRQIAQIPDMVAKDQTYQNAMKNSDKQEARTESDRVLQSVIFDIMADNMELFKQFNDNPEFKKWLSDKVFSATYNTGAYPTVGK